MNKVEAEYIARLERRADHLAVRVAEARTKGASFSYDAAELSALIWAIGKLTRLMELPYDDMPVNDRP